MNDSVGGLALPFASLSVPEPIFAWLGTTMGGILLFLFLVRRRPRDDSPSLATFVLESIPMALPVPVVPPPASTAPMASMGSAAKATKPPKKARPKKPAGLPAAAAAVAVASAFAKPPAKGVERVFVSYQGVRMAAMPDEFSTMLTRLERGDEVEIVGSQDGYLNVRTPIGLTGWIPRVTVTSVRPSARGGSNPSLN